MTSSRDSQLSAMEMKWFDLRIQYRLFLSFYGLFVNSTESRSAILEVLRSSPKRSSCTLPTFPLTIVPIYILLEWSHHSHRESIWTLETFNIFRKGEDLKR